ncbi:hypothetical protein GCM10009623_16140 [Nocardioides aestuarii]|uniref:GNAT family N-acetyltransferase n=1 Tax=Nocardioides aestuarii TaxID=252231 RepID=A0ABW4TNT2_9ACTN
MEVRELDTAEQRDLAVPLMLRELTHLVPAEATMFFDDATSHGRRVVGALDDAGTLVGFGLLTHLPWQVPGDQLAWVVVATPERGHGVGGRLYDAVLQRLPERVDRLRAITYDDDTVSCEIARHWGYEPLQLSIASTVDVSSAHDPELPAGVSVETLDHVDLDDRDAVDAMLDRSQTNPERLTGSVLTLGDFVHQQEGDRLLLGVLRVDGAPAAIVAAMHATEDGYVGYTGVDPAFRGRGLGSLLKQAVHAEARRRGVRVLGTENEQHNEGIRHVNAALGYEQQYGSWRWARPV